MNGLSTVVNALLAVPARQAAQRTPCDLSTRTGRLRALLAEGPATSRDLSQGTGLPITRVSALLANDIRRGRIRCYGGVYELDPAYDEQEARQLTAAIRTLRMAGYTVIPPAR